MLSEPAGLLQPAKLSFVPAVAHGDIQGILPGKELRHIVDLIGKVTGILRGQDAGEPLAVQLRLVYAAGGGIEPRLLHFSFQGEGLAVYIRGKPVLLVGAHTADPLGPVVLFAQKAHLEEGVGRGFFLVPFPEGHVPADSFSGLQGPAFIAAAHPVSLYLAGIEQGFSPFVPGDDPVGGLFGTAFAFPAEQGVGVVNAKGVNTVVGPQAYGFHKFSPFSRMIRA